MCLSDGETHAGGLLLGEMWGALFRTLGHVLLLLSHEELDVTIARAVVCSSVPLVTLDATVGLEAASMAFGRLVDLDVRDVQLIKGQSLGVGVCLHVLQELQDVLARLLGPPS